jgi:hypothetical protein
MQAMPRQVMILENYGWAHPVLNDPDAQLQNISSAELIRQIEAAGGSTSDCAEKGDLIDRMKELCTLKLENSVVSRSLSSVAAAMLPPPQCICGSALMRVSGKDRGFARARSFLEALQGHVISGRTFAGITCNHCNDNVSPHQDVWTCTNGRFTMLHARFFDICDACFVQLVARGSCRAEEKMEMDEMST